MLLLGKSGRQRKWSRARGQGLKQEAARGFSGTVSEEDEGAGRRWQQSEALGSPCHLLPPPAVSGRPSSTPGEVARMVPFQKCAHLGANNKERLSESVPPSPPAQSTFGLRPGWVVHSPLTRPPDPKISLQGRD